MTKTKKRPKALPVMGHTFEVRWGKEVMPDDSKSDYGHTEVESRRILINTEHHTSEAEVESTLFHESIHAVLGLAGHDHLLGDKQEEALVTCLERGLYPIITHLVSLGYFKNKVK